MFGRLGQRGTRTAEAAVKAGMSTGSLFTCVESKEALFHLVFLYCLRLLPPDVHMAARLVGEMPAWPAWHRRHRYDGKLFDHQTARRTTNEFACAALIPDSAPQDTSQTDHPERRFALP